LKELALHMMDIAENGIRAGASSITIAVLEEGAPAVLKIRVKDDGKGMEKEELLRVEDPFYTSRTTRRVGMGIPLLRQQAELAGGDLKIKSSPGRGTEVEASFFKDHPDRQPLGDLEGCWILLASVNPGIEWVLHLKSGAGEFSISTSEIKSAMELKVIAGNELLNLLKRMIRNNMEELGLA
jgi:anti-sigma regulatory factor (Ser/Thr protein kinase)